MYENSGWFLTWSQGVFAYFVLVGWLVFVFFCILRFVFCVFGKVANVLKTLVVSPVLGAFLGWLILVYSGLEGLGSTSHYPSFLWCFVFLVFDFLVCWFCFVALALFCLIVVRVFWCCCFLFGGVCYFCCFCYCMFCLFMLERVCLVCFIVMLFWFDFVLLFVFVGVVQVLLLFCSVLVCFVCVHYLFVWACFCFLWKSLFSLQFYCFLVQSRFNRCFSFLFWCLLFVFVLCVICFKMFLC